MGREVHGWRRQRRMGADLLRELPLDRGERAVSWAACQSDCRLLATTHGLWQWPAGAAPELLCWREVWHARCADGSVTVANGAVPLCEHRVNPDSRLPGHVRALVAHSTLFDQLYKLEGGTRIRVAARRCLFADEVRWVARIERSVGDPAEAQLAAGVLAAVRAEMGG